MLGVFIKRALNLRHQITPGLPCISVGNLTLGGSGKTPLCAAIARSLPGAAIVLRGYGRKSSGLVVVCDKGMLLANIDESGDEAMLYASSALNATVIVSEDRLKGIKKAKELGAKYVILDDGFSKFFIKKLDILIKPSHPPALPFCIPSGGYRYPMYFERYADLVLKNAQDFFSSSFISNPSKRMLLVSAIANPSRLSPFFPSTIAQVFFPDHYDFSEAELRELLLKFNATTLLMTRKDYVKVERFKLPVSLIEQNFSLSLEVKDILQKFINSYAL